MLFFWTRLLLFEHISAEEYLAKMRGQFSRKGRREFSGLMKQQSPLKKGN